MDIRKQDAMPITVGTGKENQGKTKPAPDRRNCEKPRFYWESGAPGVTRTRDILLRRIARN
jgi:hypothetical protein